MKALETWVSVRGLEERYEVSDLGRVRSLMGRNPQVLRATIVGKYRRVTLTLVNGKRKYVRVHALVAEAFHGPGPSKHEVRHLDGDELNNLATNLKWGTRAENNLDIVRHGRHHNTLKTHCKQGHLLDRFWGGQRRCSVRHRRATEDPASLAAPADWSNTPIPAR